MARPFLRCAAIFVISRGNTLLFPIAGGSAVMPAQTEVSVTLRGYEPHDFAAVHRLDQACFPAGIAYSKTTLKYFLSLPSADCVVAAEENRIVGFLLAEENPPLAHVITLDVAESHRRHRFGSRLLAEIEKHFGLRGVRHVLLETATANEAAVAFWQRHGYRIEAVLKRYYLGRLDAYEMRKILPAPATSQPAPKEK
jgi:[ribosomal protein S18]-alanine N-acetyltransferase